MPSIKLFRSDDLRKLANQLSDQLCTPEAKAISPFEKVEIAVGSKGMERWVRHHIARELGIAANLHFPFPMAAIDALMKAALNDNSSDSWTPTNLTLVVADTLSEMRERHEVEFAPLAHFLVGVDEPIDNTHYQISKEIASVLDGYVAYRPEMCERWDKGEPSKEEQNKIGWQPLLWGAISERLSDDANTSHRAARAKAAIKALKKRPESLSSRQPLRIFGLSSLPPTLLRELAQLSEFIQVELYLLTPSEMYWNNVSQTLSTGGRQELIDAFDEEAAHPLLGSLGRPAGELQDLIMEALGDSAEDYDLYSDNRVQCSLHSAIQDDILSALPEAEIAERSFKDDSIQIHGCYGKMRQVEALRGAIHQLLDRHNHLEPRDILVMTPDLEGFAPLVQGIFSQGQQYPDRDSGWGVTGGPSLPVRVADLSMKRLNPIADATLKLLAMCDGRTTLSGILDLIALEPVMNRFGIDDKELPVIQEWAHNSGIRWADSALERQQHGQPLDDQNTVNFGLNRLALGALFSSEVELWEGIAPLASFEGAGITVIGKFLNTCHEILSATKSLRSERSVSEWVDALIGSDTSEGVITRITKPSREAAWQHDRVRRELVSLKNAADKTQSHKSYSTSGFASLLEGRLDLSGGGTNQQTGSITLCSMRPERSIPYKVVALLGMDEGAFPRRNRLVGFDRVALNRQKGDKSSTDEDRMIFLEALLSAEEHLLVFFTGQSLKNNEELPAAVPVEQLIDVIRKSSTMDKDEVVTRHPLHHFSESLFHAGAHGIQSYSEVHRRAAHQLRGDMVEASSFMNPRWEVDSAPDTTEDTDEQITISELASWLKKPLERYIQTQWGVYLDQYEDSISDREPLEVSPLDKVVIPQDLLASRLEFGGDSLSARVLLKAKGGLPLGQAGEIVVGQFKEVIDAMLQELDTLSLTEITTLKVDETIGGVRISDEISLTGGKLVHAVPKKDSPDDQRFAIKPWIEYLLWSLTDPHADEKVYTLHGYYDKKDDKAKTQWRSYETAKPKSVLEGLVKIYKGAKRGETTVSRHSSSNFVKKWMALEKKASEDDHPDAVERGATSSAISAFFGGSFKKGDTANPTVALAWGNTPPVTVSPPTDGLANRLFKEEAFALWGPIQRGRSNVSTKKKPQGGAQ